MKSSFALILDGESGYAYGIYPRHAPEERALRSSDGVCEPASLAYRYRVSACEQSERLVRITDSTKRKNRPFGRCVKLGIAARDKM